MIDPESRRLLIQAANLNAPIVITIHNYFLTLANIPTRCALSIYDGKKESPIPIGFATQVEADDCVRSILRDFPVKKAKIYSVEHLRPSSITSA